MNQWRHRYSQAPLIFTGFPYKKIFVLFCRNNRKIKYFNWVYIFTYQLIYIYWVTKITSSTCNLSFTCNFNYMQHLVYINYLPNDVICNIAIYAHDIILYSKFYKLSDLWQQLKLASELEFDLQGTVDWGRKWLFDFNTGKTQLFV